MTLRVDNGPQLNEKCEEFRGFCEENGIKLVNTIPFWPAMNGEVERQNRSLLKRLRIAQELGKEWRVEMRQYLLTYHSTNHSTTFFYYILSPAELMFGRRIRTKLPQVPPSQLEDGEVRERDAVIKEKGRLYSNAKRKAKESNIVAGDRVVVKRMKKDNKLEASFSPEEFEVIRKNGADTVIRSCASGKEYRRNVAHLKRVQSYESSEMSDNLIDTSIDNCSSDSTMQEVSEQENEPGIVESSSDVLEDDQPQFRRTSRPRGEPKRFKDYIPY